MAGNWIKMRDDLATYPKFIGLCKALIRSNGKGLSRYVFGDEKEAQRRNESVTNVSLRALRDVLQQRLLQVWCAVNSHCKVDGEDAVCEPMTTEDIDDVSGIEGFGEAMVSVGLVFISGHNSLIFPNFCEWNEPACIRREPKTPAERQKEYRQRQKAKQPKVERVTRVTKSDGRREEKRVEENTKKPPLPPEGEEAKPAPPPFVTVDQLTFPQSIDNPEGREAVSEWLDYKRQRRQGYKNPSFVSKLLAEFSRDGPDVLRAAVDYSIGRNYQGLVRPGASSGTQSTEQRQLSELDKAIKRTEQEIRDAESSGSAVRGLPGCPPG